MHNASKTAIGTVNKLMLRQFGYKQYNTEYHKIRLNNIWAGLESFFSRSDTNGLFWGLFAPCWP